MTSKQAKLIGEGSAERAMKGRHKDMIAKLSKVVDRIFKTTKRAKVPKQHGFTLIEFLITLAILAFLVGLLVPALRKAKERAQQIKLQQQGQILVTTTNAPVPAPTVQHTLQIDGDVVIVDGCQYLHVNRCTNSIHYK